MSMINAFGRNPTAITECRRFLLFQGRQSSLIFKRIVQPALSCDVFKTFASQKSVKKERKKRTKSKSNTLQKNNLSSESYGEHVDNFIPTGITSDLDDSTISLNSSSTKPTRSAVLQACILTSGFLLALGAVIRQVSYVASKGGWVIFDSYTEVSFDFELWHLGLITGLVILVSSCRYILLETWQDFSESSEAANQQVLSSLQPLDYVLVAFLPGISEELLFRGALLPLFGLNWKSAIAIGAVFGCLHLGSGRKYSYALWATFVGFAYGLATIISSSAIVPMASHSLNNLIGGILWKYTSSQRTDN